MNYDFFNGGAIIATKAEIEKIITEAATQQIPLSHVYAPMLAGSFYTFVKKYKLKIPKYQVKFVCDVCGKDFLLPRIAAGGQSGRNIICPECKTKLTQPELKDGKCPVCGTEAL